MLHTFLSDVTEPRASYISPQRLSERLHMPMAELARLAQLHRNTLTAKPDSAKVQSRLGEIARIVDMAAELTGDTGRAVVWFRHQPIPGFDYKTAEELVEAGHADAVIKHLEMLADGVYA